MAIPRLDPVCWALILQDLCTGRLNVNGLARELDIPRSTLRGWIEGQQPGHADGERLLEFWLVHTGKPRESIPRERRPLSASEVKAESAHAKRAANEAGFSGVLNSEFSSGNHYPFKMGKW